MSFFGIVRYVCGFCQMRPVYAPIFTEESDFTQDGEIESIHQFDDTSIRHVDSNQIIDVTKLESFDLEIEEDEFIESEDEDQPIVQTAYQQSISQSVSQLQDHLDDTLNEPQINQTSRQSIAAHVPALPHSEILSPVSPPSNHQAHQSINHSAEPPKQVKSRRPSAEVNQLIDQSIFPAAISSEAPHSELLTVSIDQPTNQSVSQMSDYHTASQQHSVTPDLSVDRLIEHVTPLLNQPAEQEDESAAIPHIAETVDQQSMFDAPVDQSAKGIEIEHQDESKSSADTSLNQSSSVHSVDQSVSQSITPSEHTVPEQPVLPRRKSSVKPLDLSVSQSVNQPTVQSITPSNTSIKSTPPATSPHRRRSNVAVDQSVHQSVSATDSSAKPIPVVNQSVSQSVVEQPIVVSVVSSQLNKSKKSKPSSNQSVTQSTNQSVDPFTVVPHSKPVLPVAKPALQFTAGSNPLLALGIPRGQLSPHQLQQLIDALSPNNQSINHSKLPLIDAIREHLTWMHVWQFLISSPRTINQSTFRHFAQPILKEHQKSSNQTLSFGLQWLKFFIAHLVTVESSSTGVTLRFDQANRSLDCTLPDQWSLESKHPSDPFLVHSTNQLIKQSQDTRRVVFSQNVRCLIDSQRGLYGISPNDLSIKKIFNFSVNVSYAFSAQKLDRDSNGRVILETNENGKPIIHNQHYVPARYDDWLIGTVLGQTVEIGLPTLKNKN